MLNHLVIRNLAVIDAAEIDFSRGFTVLTGETGAGKSILFDALALALGARADSRAVRAGAERCEVTAQFALQDAPGLNAWLAEQDLDAGDECLVRRIVSADGRSRGYVNGQPVNMQTLQALGERLLDICGQQAHQGLRHRSVQRAMLDQFGGNTALAAEMANAAQAWRTARDEAEGLLAAGDDQQARQDLQRFQLQELEALNLQPGEFEALEQELRLLSHGTQLEEGLRESLLELYEADEAAAHGVVARARRRLDDLAELNPALAGSATMLAEAETLLSEAADQLRRQLDQLDHDPAREAEIGDRLASARQLARKHRCEPAALHEVAAALQAELDGFENREERLAQAQARAASLEAAARDCAGRLSKARKAAAGSLGDTVSDRMQELGMPGGRFLVSLQAVEADKLGAGGAETVEFQVAANPGQPPGPLARVASGGELSRVSLALQVVALGADAVPTLVFDEVDAGVGGGVAEMVGARLYELSRHCQVLCVTHLAQVASQADNHLRVVKITDGNTTRTIVKALTADERVEEIARMLGGVRITRRTREHALEMLQSSSARQAG